MLSARMAGVLRKGREMYLLLQRNVRGSAWDLQRFASLITSMTRQSSIILIDEVFDTILWEYLVDDESLEVQCLWGFKHDVVRLARTLSFDSSPSCSCNPCAIAVAADDDRLPFVKKIEQPFLLSDLSRSGTAQVEELPRLNPGAPVEAELQRLRRHLESSRCLKFLHFAGHTDTSRLGRVIGLRVPHRFSLPIPDIERAVPKYGSGVVAPYVVLNSCRSGRMVPGGALNLVLEFVGRNAKGVIASTTDVPDEAAAWFAKRLYLELVSARDHPFSLVTKVRREFIEMHVNPVAASYAYYAPFMPWQDPLTAIAMESRC